MRLTVQGRLAPCLLLAYRVPVGLVEPLVPSGLEPVTYRGHAFWSIVVCRIASMRPAWVPRWAGMSYHHVAYRLFVRAPGTGHDGLYFLRSDADHAVIALAGNWMTDLGFHHAKISLRAGRGEMSAEVCSVDGRGDAAVYAARTGEAALLPRSVFSSMDEREQVLKYRPLGLAMRKGGRVSLTEVIREESRWHEVPVAVRTARWRFLEHMGQDGAVLERAVEVAPIDYRWRVGGTAVAT